MSTTKTMTLDEAKKLPPMTEDEIRELENTPVRYDKDSPELSEEELSQFVPHYMALCSERFYVLYCSLSP